MDNEIEHEIEDEMEDEIDDSWITKIEEEEKSYNYFYNEETTKIKIIYVYVNKDNEIYYIKKENMGLYNKVLNKTKLLFILKKNKLHNNINHKLISILQYNIDLSPDDLSLYLKNEDNFNFLSIKSNLNELKWDDTINLFNNLNSLHIIYYENPKKKKIKYKENIYYE